jgi:alcohol dehydrogenase class IV
MVKNESNSSFCFDEPTKIIFGEGSIKKLGHELETLNSKSVLIVCDQGIAKAGLIDIVKDAIKNMSGLTINVFDGVIPNPLDTTIDEGYALAKKEKVDTVIGIGGGSSLDSAKGIALLMTNGGKTDDYLMEGKSVTREIAPTICIPTTAGTGSEVTRTVVATDHKTKFKDGFKDINTIYAKVAILDPALMEKLPPHILAACALDALTHAIESYITWKANFVTDSLNISAIKLIGDNIRKAYSQPFNLDAKGKLLLASTMAGIAFDQSGLGVAHCMGHPMGGLFDIPHGVACAMALPVAMEYNFLASTEKFVDIATALGQNVTNLNARETGLLAIKAVKDIMIDLNMPLKLNEVNISENDIPLLVKDAMGFPGMLGANPRMVSTKDMEKLYRKLL